MTEMDDLEFDWGGSERFRSNNGLGPLRARILCIADGVVTMERWAGDKQERAKKFVRFDLPLSYLKSKSCGWRRMG